MEPHRVYRFFLLFLVSCHLFLVREASCDQTDQVGKTFVREQVDQVVLRNIPSEVYYDFLLVWTNDLVFEFAEHLKKLQVKSLFRTV